MQFEDVEEGDLANVIQTARMAADSNTGGPLWSTASCDAEGDQVADADERL
jgi:hypothetical protein